MVSTLPAVESQRSAILRKAIATHDVAPEPTVLGGVLLVDVLGLAVYVLGKGETHKPIFANASLTVTKYAEISDTSGNYSCA
jgi:hypothetical protein